MKSPIKISCLPIAGIGNPYQHLMMMGLRAGGAEVIHGKEGKFFALLNTALVQRPDYLHVDWLHQYYLRRKAWMTWLLFPLFFMEILLLKTFTSTKLVWTLHNIYPHDKPQHGPYKWARKWFAYHCDWIRVFHPSTIQRASKVLGVDENKFKVVPEGAYVGYYQDKLTKKEAREQLEIGQNERILLYLGLIKPYKGILELIQILKKTELPNVRLVVAGKAIDSQYWSSITSTLPAPVLLREGFVEDNDLQMYFNAADAVILPFQRIENSGSAILAMGFSKLILAPQKGVLVERLKQQNDWLYENEEELITRLKLFAQLETERLAEIGEKNFSALEKHKWLDFFHFFIE